MMQPEPVTCLPLWLSARMRARWWLWQARRKPFRAAVVFCAAAAVITGVVLLAVHAPPGGCHWRVAGIPGGRGYYACVRAGRAA